MNYWQILQMKHIITSSNHQWFNNIFCNYRNPEPKDGFDILSQCSLNIFNLKGILMI